MPVNVTVKQSTSLVLALCKLHNFCIACTDEDKDNIDKPYQPTEEDGFNIFEDGGLLLPRMDKNTGEWDYQSSTDRVTALLDGGEHFQEYNDRRPFNLDENLPCQLLFNEVEEKNYSRPR